MICVYPADCTDFSSNGLGAVTPMSCTVTETLNGEWELTLVHDIEVEDDVIVRRMGGRRTCKDCSQTFHVENNPPKVEGFCDFCGGELTIRKDDAPETVMARLETYHKETEPLKAFYEARGKLKSVENQPSIEATTAAITKALGI